MKSERIVASMDNQESQDNPQTPQEEIQDVYVLIVREREEKITRRLLRAAPIPSYHSARLISFPRILFVCFSLFLILSTLAVSIYCMVNPPVATITIIPQITDRYTFRHVAAWQSLKSDHHKPITNHTSNRQRPPGRRKQQPDISPFITASFKVSL